MYKSTLGIQIMDWFTLDTINVHNIGLKKIMEKITSDKNVYLTYLTASLTKRKLDLMYIEPILS